MNCTVVVILLNPMYPRLGTPGLEYVLEFKYLGCVLDELDTDMAECSGKVASGGRVAGAIRSLVNARELQLECA